MDGNMSRITLHPQEHLVIESLSHSGAAGPLPGRRSSYVRRLPRPADRLEAPAALLRTIGVHVVGVIHRSEGTIDLD
jgi:hypothetical protein